jgi:hypothetical protein
MEETKRYLLSYSDGEHDNVFDEADTLEDAMKLFNHYKTSDWKQSTDDVVYIEVIDTMDDEWDTIELHEFN